MLAPGIFTWVEWNRAAPQLPTERDVSDPYPHAIASRLSHVTSQIKISFPSSFSVANLLKTRT
jgi:hypothetical protein